jgi:hypothetical protein
VGIRWPTARERLLRWCRVRHLGSGAPGPDCCPERGRTTRAISRCGIRARAEQTRRAGLIGASWRGVGPRGAQRLSSSPVLYPNDGSGVPQRAPNVSEPRSPPMQGTGVPRRPVSPSCPHTERRGVLRERPGLEVASSWEFAPHHAPPLLCLLSLATVAHCPWVL